MDSTRILQDIIAINTSVPPGDNYEKAMDYLEPLFRAAGFDTQKVHIPKEHTEGKRGERVNLLAHRHSAGKPRLIFYGHIDVVPAQGWDAFSPRVADGKVYGRGAADMKGGIAALLVGLELVKQKELKYDISVMVTTDEEAGQADQLRYLARYLEPVSGARVFSLDASFGYVGIANLGALQLDIRVMGKSVHSGLANLGENAVEKAIPLVQALLDLKKKVTQRRSQVKAHPSTGLAYMEPRLNINMIHGGLKANIVPDECLISVDRRFIPEEDQEEVRREMLDALHTAQGVRWELVRSFLIPNVPPCDDPAVDELARIIGEVTGQTGRYGEMGSGDLPYIVSGWGGKTFNLGVIRPECNIHGKDEFAYVKDMEDLARIISRFIT